VGTPYYMSPWQIQGSREIDHRADLWALASIACECLTGRRPFEAPDFIQEPAKTAAELVPALDRSVAKAKEILSTLDDAALGKMWRVTAGGKEVMAMPVGAVLRTLMLNHWYPHRGQLSVYLRQVGALVPSIYGPSADENPFAMQQAAAV
jgi:serine/threonine protein kinase